MNSSDHKMLALVKAKQFDYLAEAERDHQISAFLRATRAERGWRFRFAEVLFGLASRLSPAHRSRLARQPQPCPPGA